MPANTEQTNKKYDAIVIGLGTNGLAAALALAKRGLKVCGVESSTVLGGACRTEQPFAKAPKLKASTGAYLLGLMPPEVEEALEISIPRLERDPWYFLPTVKDDFILFSSNEEETRSYFKPRDWQAHLELQNILSQLREAIYPAFLQEPISVKEIAERYLNDDLGRIFIQLCEQPIADFLQRFDWQTERVMMMYAMTDAFTGAYGGWNSVGTGINFLQHNMCRLNSNGTWMIVPGGMGTVTTILKNAAIAAGVEIITNNAVIQINHQQGSVNGVVLHDETQLYAPVVVASCDPFRIRDLIGGEKYVPEEFNARLKTYAQMPGTSGKITFALRDHPEFTCLRNKQLEFRTTTTHLMPDVPNLVETVNRSFNEAVSGQMPEWPLLELMFHSHLDPTVRDAAGNHMAGIFIQWLPNTFKDGSSWQQHETELLDRVLQIVDMYAPGFSDLVIDQLVLTPESIAQRFGITGGSILHIDHAFFGSDRVPARWPGISGLYVGGASRHPGGGVTCTPGLLTANVILNDTGRKSYELLKTKAALKV